MSFNKGNNISKKKLPKKTYPDLSSDPESSLLKPDPIVYNGKVIEDDVDIPFDLKSEPVNFFV